MVWCVTASKTVLVTWVPIFTAAEGFSCPIRLHLDVWALKSKLHNNPHPTAASSQFYTLPYTSQRWSHCSSLQELRLQVALLILETIRNYNTTLSLPYASYPRYYETWRIIFLVQALGCACVSVRRGGREGGAFLRTLIVWTGTTTSHIAITT